MQAVSNFLAMCHGVEVGGRQLGFAGCPFTRIMARFMLQAGDVVSRDGTGGAVWGRASSTVLSCCCCFRRQVLSRCMCCNVSGSDAVR
jgi:hypothetical protein